MRNRNVALTAAYTALQHGYDRYRERVIEKYGKDEDYFFRTGIQPKAVELIEKDEDGKEKKVQTTQMVYDGKPEDPSQYGRWFDERNINYTNSPFQNLTYLMGVQKMMNNDLMVHGHVFLNEVYAALGIPHCPQGQVVGWMRDDSAGGQGYIDFGIHDGNSEISRDFVNGYEKRVFLDFNVDPLPIWDKI